MRYLSVCSGIEAASVAWEPLGWEPVAFSEIEPFPSAVLAHHFPHVPNLGDMTKHETWNIEPGSIDLLVGGTPCQSFSVAGLRKGLHDPRGGLMLCFVEIAQRLRPRWVVWENVPGVLSSNGGRDFGALLGSLGDLGYGWAYRVLDAQWVRTHRHPRAVPQRRRRVFVVGCLGDPAGAAAVLFERQSVRRDSAARGATWKGVARDTAASLTSSGRGVERAGESRGQDDLVIGATLREGAAADVASGLGGVRSHTELGDTHAVATQPVAFASNLGTRGGDIYDDGSSPTMRVGSVLGISSPPAVAFSSKDSGADASGNVSPTLRAMSHSSSHANGGGQLAVAIRPSPPAVAVSAFDARQSDVLQYGNITGPLDTDGQAIGLCRESTVRRLTPAECESLQGFPRGYTAIPWRGRPAEDCPDGPRYRALGNSMATNCMEWIGERIAEYEALTRDKVAK